MSRRLIILLVVLVVGAIAAPAAAITNGVVDDEAHPRYPFVGELLFYVPDEIDYRFGPDDPGAWFSCTGTLIAEDLVLTAGHCTWGVGLDGSSTTRTDTNNDGFVNVYDDLDPALNGSGGNDIWINFNPTVSFDPPYPQSYLYYDNPLDLDPPEGPIDGNASRYADRVAYLTPLNGWHRGTAYPHPDYDDALFFMWDVGVVQLTDHADISDHGFLAPENYLDQFIGKVKAAGRFTPVGYGLEVSRPWGAFGGDTRMFASVSLINTRGVFGIDGIARKLDIPNPSAVMSNNNGAVHQGGTCFGDSGGPVFDGDTDMIVAVTSFGMNGNCAGTGGVYRVDRAEAQTFINSFLP